MTRDRWLLSALSLGLALASPATAWAGTGSGDIDDLLVDGKFTFDVRARYEEVSQEGNFPGGDAEAPTIRARVGFLTGKVNGFQGLVEGVGVVHLSDHFNDGVNGETQYPLVPDPSGVQLNRLQVEYTGFEGADIIVGRQRINLDNQRFVGAAAWRQLEQTYDALRIGYTGIDKLSLTYIYVDQVNRVFGDESTKSEFDGPIHLFNIGYDYALIGKIVGYAYLLDLSESNPVLDLTEARAQSTATWGLRVSGKKTIADGYALGYEAEYAHQNDYADNPNDVSLNYWHGDLAIMHSGFTLLGGFETLEGNGVVGFSTPLGTLHKFQGYADAFLTTPANGIVDIYGKLGYEIKFEEPVGPITGVTAAVWYHDFDAERGGASLGREFDLEAVAKLGDHFAVGTKYANLDGDGAVRDRHKTWFYVEANY